MTDKPSDWALDVWKYAVSAYFYPTDHDEEAAALVIEQARKAWEAEVVEWLRDTADIWRSEAVRDAPQSYLDFAHTRQSCYRYAAATIERGEYRKDRG